jgi:hypothetical protein
VSQTTEQKAAAFRALHAGGPFVIPNPWDAGSARVLEALGFRALATTSSGFAFTLGRLDGAATLDEVVDHVAALATASDLPVSVDLEDGHGDPGVAISRVAEAGAVGGSIEDWDRERLYGLDEAVERVRAAVAAARAVGFPFTSDGEGREPHPRQPRPRRHDRPSCRRSSPRARTFSIAPGLSDLDEVRAALRRRLEAGERARASEPDVSGARRRWSPARQCRRIAHVGGGTSARRGRRPRSAPGATSLCSARARPQTGSSPLKSGRAASLGMPPSP